MKDGHGDEEFAGGGPLPPEDRLWRHPSELGRHGTLGSSAPTPAPAATAHRPVTSTARRLTLVATSAALGGVSAIGLLLAVGALDPQPAPNDRPVMFFEEVSDPVDPEVAAEQVLTSVMRLEVTTPDGARFGSAVIVRDDGQAYTTASLVAGATELFAVDHDGNRHSVTLVGADATTDVALLSIDGNGFTPALIGTADDLMAGQRIIAVSPSRSDFSAPSISIGVVEDTQADTERADDRLYGLLAATSGPGTYAAGSILLDDQGALVGVVSAETPDQPAVSSIASRSENDPTHAIPIETVRDIADALALDGAVVHPYLGAEVTPTDDGSLEVSAVEPDSPAAEAGLRVGDLVDAVAGREVQSPSQFVLAVRDQDPGDSVEITFLRDGTRETCSPILRASE